MHKPNQYSIYIQYYYLSIYYYRLTINLPVFPCKKVNNIDILFNCFHHAITNRIPAGEKLAGGRAGLLQKIPLSKKDPHMVVLESRKEKRPQPVRVGEGLVSG